MESGGAKKRRRRGALCDLQPNFRDLKNAHQSSTQSSYLLSPKARTESWELSRNNSRRSSVAAKAAWNFAEHSMHMDLQTLRRASSIICPLRPDFLLTILSDSTLDHRRKWSQQWPVHGRWSQRLFAL